MATLGHRASRSSRSAPTSTTFRRRRRSPASPTTIRSSKARPATARGTTPACRCNIAAALAVKKVMEREHLPGTLQALARRRRGAARHQGVLRARRRVQGRRHLHLRARRRATCSVGWGDSAGNGLVSVEYNFKGESAHAAGAPWRGRSRARRGRADGRRLELPPRAPAHPAALALRDHQRRRSAERRPAQRVGLVLLPRNRLRRTSRSSGTSATTWRKAAALMTDTDVHVAAARLGLAGALQQDRSPRRCTRTSRRSGLPHWTEADQTLAKALQHELKVPEIGPGDQDRHRCAAAKTIPDEEKRGGGSDDIGDISWNVPTVTLRYPVQHPRPARATTGPTPSRWRRRSRTRASIAGAKVQAHDRARPADCEPELVDAGVGLLQQRPDQGPRSTRRSSGPDDKPAIWLNKETMEKYRPEMKKYYYDPTKYKTYLEQLGIKYPDGEAGRERKLAAPHPAQPKRTIGLDTSANDAAAVPATCAGAILLHRVLSSLRTTARTASPRTCRRPEFRC